MKFVGMTRKVIAATVVGAVVTVVSGTVGLTACGDSASCTKTRNDTFAKLQNWQSCNPEDVAPCIKVAGNPRDCSGVLSCDFAVNLGSRVEAEQTVLTIGNETQGCYLCATPNCVAGDLAICEPFSRKCIIVSGIVDAGGPGMTATIDVAIPPNFLPDGAFE